LTISAMPELEAFFGLHVVKSQSRCGKESGIIVPIRWQWLWVMHGCV
jgi:hypothetical protein